MNIDANTIYAESLQAIQDAVGGHFQTCAVTDHEGDIEITTSVHPYWTSLRPAGDLYWERVNKLAATKTVVPATTLDTLRRKLALRPPFLLKLDVQGAEVSVLRGASDLLKDTHVVIVEADVDDYQEINARLVENNFILYDLTQLSRTADGTLGWFYPVYINRALDFVLPKSFWDPKENEAIIGLQVERRKAILKSNADILARIRNPPEPLPPSTTAKPPVETTGRNQPCPCGSGKNSSTAAGAYR